MDFRYFCLNVQYRQKINFTWEAMDGAKSAYGKLCQLLLQHKNGTEHVDQQQLENYKQQFEQAINDDLNVPLAIGVLWTMLRNSPKSKQVYDMALVFDKVFALDFDKVKEEEKPQLEIPEEVKLLVEQRKQARLNKNWAESDRLRDEIATLGYVVRDTAKGMEIDKK